MTRWIAALVAAVLAMQVWFFRELGQVRREAAQIRERQEYLLRQNVAQLNGLESAIREAQSFPDWLTRPEVTATPDPACREHRVSAAFSLKEWTPGTKAHFQFRRGTGEAWQEATVEDLGQQSYAASLVIPGGPALDWRLHIASQGGTGPGTVYSGPATVYWPPDTHQFRTGFPAAPALQYRIVVDVPGGSRATTALPIQLGPQLTVPASVSVQVTDQTYQVTVDTPRSPASPCMTIGKLTAIALASDRALGEHPLAQDPATPWRWSARWQSDTPATRISLAVDYAGVYSTVVPIELRPPQ